MVGVELLAAAAFVGVFVPSLWARVAGGVLLAVPGVLLMIRIRGRSAGARIGERLAYGGRPRIAVAASTPDRETASTAEDPVLGPDGEVPPDLHALFDGDLSVVSTQGRPGCTLGAYRHAGRWGTVLRVRAYEGVLETGGAATVPLRELWEGLARCEVPSLSVRVIQFSCGRGRATLPPSLAALVEELGKQDTGCLRNARELLLFVSFDPAVATDAVKVRGSGLLGVARVLAAVSAVSRAALSTPGVTVDVLERDELIQVLERLLLEPVRACEPVSSWTEEKGCVASNRVYHRTLTAVGWKPGAEVSPVLDVPAYGVVTAVDLEPDATGGGAVGSLLVRVAARRTDDLASTVEEVRRTADSAGIRLRVMEREQLIGLRATTGAGVLSR